MVRRVLIVLILFLSIFNLIFTAQAGRGFGIKRFVLESKIEGELPHLSWVQFVRFLISPGTILPGPLADLPSIHPVERRQGSCPVQWETPLGRFWGRSDEADLLVFLVGEQSIFGIYQHEPVVVHKGDVVLDAGANLGTFTRFALNRGARRVIAFEPEPTNIACFKKTFKKELESGKIVLVEAALWDSSGTLQFSEPPEGNSGRGSVVETNGVVSVTVRATTIDESVAALNLDRVDFIKMDIEGAERHALLGGQDTLARFAPRMALSVEHLTDDPEVIPRAVLQARPDYKVLRGPTVFYCY